MSKMITMSRAWAMPSETTFSITPIKAFVARYLRLIKSNANQPVIVDPFARDSTLATYSNDLNPGTGATHHMEAVDFLQMLKDRGILADLILFDPPYSYYQAKTVYQEHGARGYTREINDNVGHWSKEKNLCYDILRAKGYFLHFGWHSNGMGKKRGMRIVEILLVAHGRCHNDTICTAEVKMAHQGKLF